MNRFMRRWFTIFCLLLIATPLLAQEQVKIGILAFRPKPQVQTQWNPLATALNKAIPDHTFTVKAYNYDELQPAIAKRQIDFVLTNPGHYVLMSRHIGLSPPIATQINLEQGKPVTVFGGVIFTRADRTDIRQLEDIRGKTVAATAIDSLGGYQMQAYELSQAGLRLQQDIRLLATGMPHDNVVDAVLAKRADVGFVRSGVIESLVREGKLDPASIAVINRQNLPGFPVLVSTRLYPEWPFAALPHTDRDLKRKVASFLLTLEEDKTLTQALRIHGFDVPSDYSSVEQVLRELRMPPFDTAPAFTVNDVWERYRWPMVASLVAAGLILLLGFRLLLAKRGLETEKIVVQKQTEALKVSELRFRTVADYTHDWEYWLGPNHEVFYMSPSCKNITGYTCEEFTADPSLLERIIHPDDQPSMAEHMHEAQQLRSIESFDFRILRRDGSVCWIGHVCQPVYDDAGKYNGRRVTNRDITERKRDEAKLIESESRLRAIIQNEPECIKIVDAQGRLMQMNPAGLAMLEADSLDQVVGNPVLNVISPEYRKAYIDLHHRVLAGESMQMEYEVVGLKGGRRWLETHAVPMKEENGATVHLAVTRDITERKRSEQVLQQSKEAAIALAQSKSEFLANMSHEIRTPMNGIIGLTQLALNQPTSPQVRDYLNKISSSSQSLLGILNDILDFSKLEADRIKIENSPFDLDILLDNLRNLFEERAHAKHLDFAIEVSESTPRDLLGDAMRLQQILINLLGNAIKFTSTGHVTLAVSVLHVEGDQTRLCFAVEDTGIGIAQDDLDKLFHPFSQVDGSITRRFGGTGLGLAISYNLLHLMGSEFSVQSLPGQGTTFSFDLLFGIATNEKARPIRKRARHEAGALGHALGQNSNLLQGIRILVAEDNHINQQVVKEFLMLSGMDVTVANNGQETIDLLQTQHFDAILMDVHMPVMGGVEATRRIREQPQYQQLPIIALTAGVTHEEHDNCLACGMTDFIAKPIDPETLIAILSKWVQPKIAPVSSTRQEIAQAMILLVNDEPEQLQWLASILRRDYQVKVATSGAMALDIAQRTPRPDLILLDADMPEMNGYEMCRQLAESANTRDIPLMLLMPEGIIGGQVLADKIGVAGLIEALASPEDMLESVRHALAGTIQ